MQYIIIMLLYFNSYIIGQNFHFIRITFEEKNELKEMGREQTNEQSYWRGSSMVETKELLTKPYFLFLTTQLNHISQFPLHSGIAWVLVIYPLSWE